MLAPFRKPVPDRVEQIAHRCVGVDPIDRVADRGVGEALDQRRLVGGEVHAGDRQQGLAGFLVHQPLHEVADPRDRRSRRE